jgi:hypothetical protein
MFYFIFQSKKTNMLKFIKTLFQIAKTTMAYYALAFLSWFEGTRTKKLFIIPLFLVLLIGAGCEINSDFKSTQEDGGYISSPLAIRLVDNKLGYFLKTGEFKTLEWWLENKLPKEPTVKVPYKDNGCKDWCTDISVQELKSCIAECNVSQAGAAYEIPVSQAVQLLVDAGGWKYQEATENVKKTPEKLVK